jgi:preprotein translocase subunit SecD
MQDAQMAASYIKNEAKDLEQKVEGSTIHLQLPEKQVKKIKSEALARNVEVLRTRMRSSIAETPIATQGDKRIVIELPDTADPQEAKARIGKAAQLEFRLVERIGRTADEIRLEYDGDIPSDTEILPGKRGDEFFLVQKYTDITGKLLRDARPAFGGQTGVEPVVSFKFNEVGAEKFYDLTSKNYGRLLAIVLDGIVISYPRINEPIKGDGQISGDFTAESARELALLLNSGAFVAPVTFEEERQIGPSLGAESIKQGLLSCLVGLGLLFVFSILIYKIPGIFSFIALLYNLLLILLGLVWLKATLTLPGIAGMVLTVGMAIDASILVYERIREKLAQGMPLHSAVSNGFSGAMGVILDANITTFIVGAVLYKFGTGPVQGFAVTMMLGIISTLITGLFFLRSLFKFILNNFHIQKLRF